MFAVAVYCGAPRREEVPLMDLEATKEFSASGMSTRTDVLKIHLVIALQWTV
jgi:hypothetical protein